MDSKVKTLHAKVRVDTDPQGSKHSGIAGFYEKWFRKFKTAGYLTTIAPLYALSGVMLGVAIVPAISVYRWLNSFGFDGWLSTLMQGLGIGVGFFAFGFTLILVAPFLNFVFRTTPKPGRGTYYSVENVKWFVHNAFTYLVRYTFLEFITPTPFNLMFFQMMGMKIGKNTAINTSNISDPGMIELGDRVTIGGSATLCAHYGMGGFLILAPLKIGNDVTIGLKASVMGGVEIGDGAKVMPHSVVLPKTKILPGETWGGVPAVNLTTAMAAAAAEKKAA